MPTKAVAVRDYSGNERRFWTGKVEVDADGVLHVGKKGRVARYQAKAWASYEVFESPTREEAKVASDAAAYSRGFNEAKRIFRRHY